jgi:hypothetical protein
MPVAFQISYDTFLIKKFSNWSSVSPLQGTLYGMTIHSEYNSDLFNKYYRIAILSYSTGEALVIVFKEQNSQ